MKPTVFVTQIPHKREAQTWVPIIDVTPAAEHGTLRIILPFSQANMIDSAPVVKAMRDALSEYDFSRGDCLILTGDPSLIALAGAIISDYSECMRLLRWDRHLGKYIPVEINLE